MLCIILVTMFKCNIVASNIVVLNHLHLRLWWVIFIVVVASHDFVMLPTPAYQKTSKATALGTIETGSVPFCSILSFPMCRMLRGLHCYSTSCVNHSFSSGDLH